MATEKAGTGKRIVATIAPSFSAGADAVLVELAGFDEAMVEFEGSDDVLVEQPDAATATPTAMAAASLEDIRART